jgi:catechol 2,3-dioxygenase
MSTNQIDPNVQIGHVHLKVSDLERSLKFYCDVLGFALTQRYGTSAAFVSAGGYHHHIGLNTWESKNGTKPKRNMTGLYHFAILYPTKKSLHNALLRLQKHNIQLTGASDHGVSLALYLEDPDGNGIELYWDRPKSEWPIDENGNLAMISKELNFAELKSSN